MKKRLFFLTFLTFVLLTSCMTNKLDPLTLESNVFVVSEIRIFNNFDDAEKYVEDYYKSVSFDIISKEFLEKENLNLDFSLFDENDYKNYSVEKVKAAGLEAKYVDIKKSTDSLQTACLSIVWNFSYNHPSWEISLILPNGKFYSYFGEDKYWAKEPYISDKENDVLVEIEKPKCLYLQQVNGESFYSYTKNNEQEGSNLLYFPSNQEIELVYSVSDPGNFLYEGGIWQNQKEKISFKKGKQYVLSYKIDRSTFLKRDWSVSLRVKEKD